MHSMMRPISTFHALAALAVLGTTVHVGSAHAKSSVSVTSAASVIGTVVQGSVVIKNTTSKTVLVTAVKETLEVRYDAAATPPGLPPGSDSGYYVVATLLLPPPGSLAPLKSVNIPFSIDTCAPQVARYPGAKDMRSFAAVTAAGQVTVGKSPNFVPPSQSLCPMCGNGRIEVGEQCDGGACCTACRAVANGTGCADGNACTRVDQCQNGACVGGSPVVCVAADQCHDAGTCNPVNGTCSDPNKANGASCNDNDACTRSDRCLSGACRGTTMSCSDGNVCTTDSCSDGSCVYADNSNPCDDGSVCTENDTCAGGECVSGEPRSCDDHKVCTTDVCEEVSACAHTATDVCDGCFGDECLLCQDECVAANTQCITWCWEGFWSCLNGCTSTYCAPFCQVDLGFCLDACPDVPTCDTGCETGNGCAVGCTQPQ